MATLKLITNLKLIDGTARTNVPTTTELPKGYMAFGVVNGRASIWGNYNDTVVDLIQAGTVQIEIKQETGNSLTAVMSQDATTRAINAVSQSVTDLSDSLGTAAHVNTGTAQGNVPVLDANGKLPEGVIPAVAITDVFVVDSEAAMLALNAQVGDIAIRTDINRTYILQNTPASTLANWQEILVPSNYVTSVNGKSGTVVLGGADILSTFTMAASRVNVESGESVATSLGKIAKWLNDLKGLAFKDKINAATDITGKVPMANLPYATYTGTGVISVDATAFNLNEAKENRLELKTGTGIKVDANGVQADVALEIALI